MTMRAGSARTPRFDVQPDFADLVEAEAWARPVRSEGIGSWAMPLALWHSPDGLEAEDPKGPGHHTLAFTLTGSSVEGRRGRRRDTIPGGWSDFFGLQPKGTPTDYRSRTELRFGHLYFSDEFLRAVGMDLFGSRADDSEIIPLDVPFIAAPELRKLTDAYLTAAIDPSEAPCGLEMDCRATLILANFLRRHTTLAPCAEARSMTLTTLTLARVKEYLDAHISETVSLSDIAATAELSPFHFARAFKRETGITPHRYLMGRRVQRARELLVGSSSGLSEIALACGFAGQSHFTTAFKRHTGTTPAAWRAAMRH